MAYTVYVPACMAMMDADVLPVLHKKAMLDGGVATAFNSVGLPSHKFPEITLMTTEGELRVSMVHQGDTALHPLASVILT